MSSKQSTRSRAATPDTDMLDTLFTVLRVMPDVLRHLFSDENRKQVHAVYEGLTNVVDMTEDYSADMAGMIGDILAAVSSISLDAVAASGVDVPTDGRALLRPAQQAWKTLISEELAR